MRDERKRKRYYRKYAEGGEATSMLFRKPV
jgi:hypothetical protein